MYVHIVGEIEMIAQNQVIGSVKAGETFGEMAVIAQAARTATARAKTQCTLIGLDEKQYQQALQQKPEFALMLMSIMNSRLRSTISRLRASGSLHAGTAKENPIFDKKMLAGLANLMKGQDPVTYPAGKMIMQEGTGGAFMYSARGQGRELHQGRRRGARGARRRVRRNGAGGPISARRDGHRRDALQATRGQPQHLPAPGEDQSRVWRCAPRRPCGTREGHGGTE
jgi:hypothetical protein